MGAARATSLGSREWTSCNTSSNTGAVDDTACGAGDVVDVWYCFEAPCTDLVIADTCSFGTDFDTTLAVFAQCAMPFLEIACDDDGCGTLSRVAWSAEAGRTYYLRVSGVHGETGPFELRIRCGNVGDDCSDPIPVREGGFVGTLADNTGQVDPTTCGAGDVVDEWYAYTASCDGTATASTCGPGTGFDTTLAVFELCAFGIMNLACSDDFCGDQSQVSWAALAGTTYYVRVSGTGGGLGPYALSIGCGTSNDLGLYYDPGAFLAAVADAGLVLAAADGFEEAQLPPPPGNMAYMDDPLDPATDNGVFAPGEVAPGYQSNVDGPGIGGPDPAGAMGLVVYGPGFGGVPDTAVMAGAYEHGLDAVVDLPTDPIRALALRVADIPIDPMRPVQLSLFDPGGAVLGAFVTPPRPDGFLGIAPLSLGTPGPAPAIGRLNVWSPAGGREGLYELSAYADGPDCPADVSNSGAVDVEDLLLVLGQWGPCTACPADINGDGAVGVDDMLAVLGSWGPC